jgi:2-polyprenyl-6-methoxyphenol hydroxylase-like FAD-dependent oxidoreductase
MNERSVLISGAGIAGTTLAYWLARHGFHPTVVERGGELRSSGNPVDVRGRAVAVADGMGVMPRLRAAATAVRGMTFVNDRGRRVGRVNLHALRQAGGSREVELPRADLASILYAASGDGVEYVFGDSIATLTQDGGGVDVTFERGAPRRFGLVVGADGLHSTVRGLAFGPEPDYVRHLGVYIATMPLDGPVGDGTEVLMYNAPGRAVSLHPGSGQSLAAFMFRGPIAEGFDHRDTARHRRLVREAFAPGAWRVPELLEQVRTAGDLYFDSVSQVRIDRWSAGRIALLGDAASCVSLFGDGSTNAMLGAFTLAAELAAAPAGDHLVAFARYEAAHRAVVGPRQRAMGPVAALLIPATRGGIAVRNLATRLWPAGAAAGWVRSRFAARPAVA